MPCCLDDLLYAVILKSRRCARITTADARVIAVERSKGGCCGGRRGGRAVNGYSRGLRRVEQDEVLLRRALKAVLLLRGWCRRARRTGGKP